MNSAQQASVMEKQNSALSTPQHRMMYVKGTLDQLKTMLDDDTFNSLRRDAYDKIQEKFSRLRQNFQDICKIYNKDTTTNEDFNIILQDLFTFTEMIRGELVQLQKVRESKLNPLAPEFTPNTAIFNDIFNPPEEPALCPEALQQQHGGEFSSSDYQNYLREHIKAGSKLMTWRDTPIQHSTVPPTRLGCTLTCVPGGEPAPDCPWVVVSVDELPGHPPMNVHLNSVFLLAAPRDDVTSHSDVIRRCFDNPEYLTYLKKVVRAGQKCLLWRDCETSGLMAGRVVVVVPTGESLGDDLVTVTSFGDTSGSVYKVSLRSCCLSLPCFEEGSLDGSEGFLEIQ